MMIHAPLRFGRITYDTKAFQEVLGPHTPEFLEQLEASIEDSVHTVSALGYGGIHLKISPFINGPRNGYDVSIVAQNSAGENYPDFNNTHTSLRVDAYEKDVPKKLVKRSIELGVQVLADQKTQLLNQLRQALAPFETGKK